jgi:hypothetical protein
VLPGRADELALLDGHYWRCSTGIKGSAPEVVAGGGDEVLDTPQEHATWPGQRSAGRSARTPANACGYWGMRG